MRRALACILVIMLLFSISGCTPKSEYQKLQEEKVAIEKQNTSLTLAKARVEEKVAAQQKEISGLKTALKGKEGAFTLHV